MKQDKPQSLPIFPLSIFLLPSGVTRLRVFEPRYLKLVGIASNGFIISPKSEREKELQWGSWVEIVNFDQGEDGVLEIDVRCKSLVNLHIVEPSSDGLEFAQVSEVTHWAQKRSSANLGKLTGSLLSLFNENDFLHTLYETKETDNPYWVVARWLELLPIPVDVKNSFLQPSTYVQAKKLVSSII